MLKRARYLVFVALTVFIGWPSMMTVWAHIQQQSSSTHSVSVISGASFLQTGQSESADDWHFSFDGGYLTNDSDTNEVCLAAPVSLPIGGIVESFTVYVYDNYSLADVTVYLDKTSILGGASALASIKSNNSDTIETLSTTNIAMDDDAHVVVADYNYHISFCLPASSEDQIKIYGAKVGYRQIEATYLPLIVRNPTPTPTQTATPTPTPVFTPTPTPLPQTMLYLSNDTGGPLTYTIFDTLDKGTITCGIDTGAVEQFCASFAAGTYDWRVVTTKCRPTTGEGSNKAYPVGDKRASPFFCR